MRGFDFIILAYPRSGTHMLASALDSHPEIQCLGEPWLPYYDFLGAVEKRIRGCIMMPEKWHRFYRSEIVPKKAIVLKRNWEDRRKSWLTTLPGLHTTEPAVVRRKIVHGHLPTRQPYLLEEIEQEFEATLTLHYEEITRGRHIDTLDIDTTQALCDFLGVEAQTLSTRFCKPEVIEPQPMRNQR